MTSGITMESRRPTDESNEVLAQRAATGDRSALSALVQSQQSYVYSIALSVMRNAPDASDMAQQAFIRMMRSLHTYRGDTKFTTWLYRLVVNVCLDEMRRRRYAVQSLDRIEDDVPMADTLPDADPWSQPEESTALRESASEVRWALAQLPAPQRIAITLRYFSDLPGADVAAVMGVPENTVKSHVRRGKERMMTLLRQSATDSTASRREITLVPAPHRRVARHTVGGGLALRTA